MVPKPGDEAGSSKWVSHFVAYIVCRLKFKVGVGRLPYVFKKKVTLQTVTLAGDSPPRSSPSSPHLPSSGIPCLDLMAGHYGLVIPCEQFTCESSLDSSE